MKKVLVPVLALVCLFLATPSFALFDSKFEAEATKETEAVKLVRDTAAGGYNLLTAAELKKMIDEGKDMVIVDGNKQEYPAYVEQALRIVFQCHANEGDAGRTGLAKRADAIGGGRRACGGRTTADGRGPAGQRRAQQSDDSDRRKHQAGPGRRVAHPLLQPKRQFSPLRIPDSLMYQS